MAPQKKVVKTAKASNTMGKPAAPATRRSPAKAPPRAPANSTPRASTGRIPAPSPVRDPDVGHADPALFDPLTAGEVADALRTLTEDRRLTAMAKVGRYRVICAEPLVVKPPHWMAGHRLARVVVYDYAADRAVDACVDLDAGVVAHLTIGQQQPMLSSDEEAMAISIALTDRRVLGQLAVGDVAQSTAHYWGRNASDIAASRRSAAVMFGRQDGHASLVAVVDLLDSQVTQVVPAGSW